MKRSKCLFTIIMVLVLTLAFSMSVMAKSNALRSAKNYLSVMPFSHDSLVAQFEWEGFTHDEAVAAADACGADWNAQAVKKVQDYNRAVPMSYLGMINQLELFDKFTHEQAVFGADNSGTDWTEKAIEKAKVYNSILPFSRSRMIDQLKFDKFTDEEAEAAVNALGL